MYHLRTYEPTSYPIQEQLNFFKLCVNCIAEDMHESLDILVYYLVRRQTTEHALSQHLFGLLKEYITIHWSSNAATHFFNRISGKLIKSETEAGFYPMIDFEQIQNLSLLLLDRILEELNRPRVNSILDDNSPLNFFLKMMIYDLGTEEYPYNDSLVINGLIKHHTNRTEEDTFEEFIAPLYEKTIPEYISRQGYIEGMIHLTFGHYGNFKAFAEACFELDKETLQKHYQNLGID